MLFFLNFNSNNSEKNMYHGFHKYKNNTVFNIDNNKKCFWE